MKYGIYVNEPGCIPYAEALCQGYKTIETRTKDTLGFLVGENVLIIRTKRGMPSAVIGTVKISEKRFYSVSELENLRDKTLIPPGSMFDCKGRGKWGYTVENPIIYSKPIPLSAFSIVKKTRVYALLTA